MVSWIFRFDRSTVLKLGLIVIYFIIGQLMWTWFDVANSWVKGQSESILFRQLFHILFNGFYGVLSRILFLVFVGLDRKKRKSLWNTSEVKRLLIFFAVGGLTGYTCAVMGRYCASILRTFMRAGFLVKAIANIVGCLLGYIMGMIGGYLGRGLINFFTGQKRFGMYARDDMLSGGSVGLWIGNFSFTKVFYKYYFKM